MRSFVMRRWSVLVLGTLAAVFEPHGSAQSLTTQSAMHDRITAIYNFSPSKVTREIRESKSAEMDSFWDEVKGHRDAELPLLRKELEDPDNPRFFFADGCALLLSLSQSPADQNLAILALSRVDLADFQSRQYLEEVHALAMKGANVTPAALHILDDPKFEVFLAEHGAYRLDQTACLLVALLPLSTSVWLPAVMERIQVEHDETAMKSLLLLLFYAQTDEADREIKAIATGDGSPPAIRDFASSILKHERELGTGKQPSRQLETKLRRDRQERMAAVSDEAIDDMNQLTERIARARTLPQ